jgi:hypothetical protein
VNYFELCSESVTFLYDCVFTYTHVFVCCVYVCVCMCVCVYVCMCVCVYVCVCVCVSISIVFLFYFLKMKYLTVEYYNLYFSATYVSKERLLNEIRSIWRNQNSLHATVLLYYFEVRGLPCLAFCYLTLPYHAMSCPGLPSLSLRYLSLPLIT